MLCKIYRLRNFGDKLTKEEIQATECVAYLVVHKDPSGEPTDTLTITLKGGMGYMSFGNAKVRVVEDGLMISADEHAPGPYGHRSKQVWYCLPLAEGEPTSIDQIGTRIRSIPSGSYL